jgi:putative redox protein
MVEIYVRYDGGLRCSTRHGPSGSKFVTDAPVDNHGRGEAFSPTDLIATSLGTCMVTTMGIAAQRRGWNIDGIEVHVVKHMTKEPPRRIAQLTATLSVPDAVAAALDTSVRKELEHIAETCPVRLSLHPEVAVPMQFRWGGAAT